MHKQRRIKTKLILLMISCFLFLGNLQIASAETKANTLNDSHLLIFSSLAYVHFNSTDIGKSIQDLKQLKEVHDGVLSDLASVKATSLIDELKNWKLVKTFDDPDQSGIGFSIFRNESTNELVIAYRGTALKEVGDIMADINILLEPGNLDSQQEKMGALNIAAVIAAYPTSKIYITGHSLGGYLAQVMTVLIKERKLESDLVLPKIKEGENVEGINELQQKVLELKDALVKIPYDSNIVRTVTFNAPGSSQSSLRPNYGYKTYGSLVTNHVILSDQIGNLFTHLGSVVYHLPMLKEVVPFKAHSLTRFYKNGRIITSKTSDTLSTEGTFAPASSEVEYKDQIFFIKDVTKEAIYSRPINSANAKKLDTVSSPRFSVYEDWLYYEKNHSLWKMKTDGSKKQMILTPNKKNNYLWPLSYTVGDGQIFINGLPGCKGTDGCGGISKLYQMDTSGTHLKQIGNDSPDSSMYMKDGKLFYLTTQTNTKTYPETVKTYDYKSKKPAIKTLFTLDYLRGFHILDDSIIYKKDETIYKRDLNGKNEQTLFKVGSVSESILEVYKDRIITFDHFYSDRVHVYSLNGKELKSVLLFNFSFMALNTADKIIYTRLKYDGYFEADISITK
ncbi:lipase family protein [Cohnella yongneupensis]|uniref:Prolow-density lipoprotein receptor-related protein 1-like beta-propeller domain-containing protein n=1 Tax=Cohnella yongneupensis TaxID=425006 RepID=A0ABW0R1V3_9BACL